MLPAGPLVLPPTGLVLLPPTAVADADGVTVADDPGEVVEAVEVASAWLPGDSDADGAPGWQRGDAT